MTDTANGNAPKATQRKSLLQRISSSMSIGAVAAMFLSDPSTISAEVDSRMTLSDAVFGCLGVTCLFGIPAGLLLALRDRSKNVTSAWSAVWNVPGSIFFGSFALVILIYGLGEINAISALVRERLGPAAENSGLSELAKMIAGSFWGLALMLLYTSSETLNRRLEGSGPEPSTSPVTGDAEVRNAATDSHSQAASLPSLSCESAKPPAEKLSLWGLAGIFPFVLALLIWKAGVTRSYNMALEVCFVLSFSIIWLSFLSDAVSSLSENDRYVIMNWRPVVFVAAIGVVGALSYWWGVSALPEKGESESRSIDLFLVGVWVFNRLNERWARRHRMQVRSSAAEGT